MKKSLAVVLFVVAVFVVLQSILGNFLFLQGSFRGTILSSTDIANIYKEETAKVTFFDFNIISEVLFPSILVIIGIFLMSKAKIISRLLLGISLTMVIIILIVPANFYRLTINKDDLKLGETRVEKFYSAIEHPKTKKYDFFQPPLFNETSISFNVDDLEKNVTYYYLNRGFKQNLGVSCQLNFSGTSYRKDLFIQNRNSYFIVLKVSSVETKSLVNSSL